MEEYANPIKLEIIPMVISSFGADSKETATVINVLGLHLRTII